MKKILLPTDFSEVASNAFIHALEFAKVMNAEIILLHSYKLPITDNSFYPENYGRILETVELANFENFKEYASELHEIAGKRNLGKIKLSHRLMDGDLIFSIQDCIKEYAIDYIIMGTSGATGWSQTFFGTNTGEVIMTVSIPILSVPLEAKFTKIKNIGFTTRYREKDRLALKEVIDLAKKMNAKVKCLYVSTNESENTEATFDEWEHYFKNEPVQFFKLPSNEVLETIKEFIASQEIDLLAMQTYKRNFIESIFSSSFTEKFSFSSSVPLLVFHE